jgi:hypothetical protein
LDKRKTEMAEWRGDRGLKELATRINREHGQVEESLRSGLGHARAAGELLLEAKGKVAHGRWLPWLSANVTFSNRTAQAYMRVAKGWDRLTAKAQGLAHLGFEDALDLLAESASVPESGRASAEDEAPAAARVVQAGSIPEDPGPAATAAHASDSAARQDARFDPFDESDKVYQRVRVRREQWPEYARHHFILLFQSCAQRMRIDDEVERGLGPESTPAEFAARLRETAAAADAAAKDLDAAAKDFDPDRCDYTPHKLGFLLGVLDDVRRDLDGLRKLVVEAPDQGGKAEGTRGKTT